MNTLLRPPLQDTEESLQSIPRRTDPTQLAPRPPQSLIYPQPIIPDWNSSPSHNPIQLLPTSHYHSHDTCPHLDTLSSQGRQQLLPNYTWNTSATSSTTIPSSFSYSHIVQQNSPQQHSYPSFPQPPSSYMIHTQTQIPSSPPTVHRAVQTDAIYVCNQCSVIDEYYITTPFTIQLCGLLTKHLASSLYVPLSRIAARAGTWAASVV